ncbi:glycosyltransferase [Kocuria arenosa]|uniref:glycosyltransferase n=1 Tax=Kocuria arenosa TaxID=3071446 RepID=UPI0034D45E20
MPNAIVVCPTEYGGHIEHAADTALALAQRPGINQVVLLSRPGAAEYLGCPGEPRLRIVETVPPRRPARVGRVASFLRAGLQILDLAREHARIRRVTRLADPHSVIVLDSSKYPWPDLLRGHRTQRIVLFVHNARPHFDAHEASLRQRVILRLERSCMRKVDRIITHGSAQQEIIQANTDIEVLSVHLPLSTRLDFSNASGGDEHGEAPQSSETDSPFALCVGELRSNKGIEQAIAASKASRVPLRVHGRSEDPELGTELARLAEGSKFSTLDDRFLSRNEFNELLENAAVIVLPYLHFDAQSGVLSKAMNVGARVVASDLQALRDQADSYPAIVFGDVHNPEEFGALLRSAYDEAVRAGRHPSPQSLPLEHDGWDSIAEVLLKTDGHAVRYSPSKR